MRKKSNSQTFVYIALSLSLTAIVLYVWWEQSDANITFTEASLYAPYAASLADIQNIEELQKKLKEKNEELRRSGAIKVPIIVYHSIRPYTIFDTKFVKRFVVEPKVLDGELAYIETHGYHTISMETLADHFKNGTPLPAKPIILTFDDDWENQYVNVLPLLTKHHQTATFFIFTVAIGKKHFMNEAQIASLGSAGMEIGGHTKTHPYLFKIKDQGKIDREILDGRTALETMIGKPVKVFATPYSRTNESINATLMKSGFIAARTEAWGSYQSDDTLNFTGIEAPNSVDTFVKLLEL